jgi:hypothetical protein
MTVPKSLVAFAVALIAARFAAEHIWLATRAEYHSPAVLEACPSPKVRP